MSTTHSVPDLIAWKRDGHAFNDVMIHRFIDGLLSGEVAPEQVGAWLMACQIQGLTPQETSSLTKHMATSGATLERRTGRVDKHSTGGVGDKMSLILAPCLAASGLVVPMLAGRGLAHTGGTIDKLEAIPGFNTGLSLEAMRTNPCFISRQTEGIAPADRILYAARDVTATVPQIGLITASIVSKKYAEGLERLVLDVKCGRAAFMQTLDEARALARSMVHVGSALGMEVTAQITSMDHPIGRLLGNAHEVAESIHCLRGEGPEDTMELVRMQANALGADVDVVIASGSALEAFADMCRRQGVEEKTVASLIEDPWSVLSRGKVRTTVKAPSSGWVSDVDALALGRLLVQIGAGRNHPADVVDHGAGIEVLAHVGDRVEEGQPLMIIDHNRSNAIPAESTAFTVQATQPTPRATSRLLESIDVNDVQVV
ncbi:MAG TPA: thymidine phosphorylase [Candidatus Poseidoniaceae archaeon]|nr:thymidine phosphorylase [Candidatus Poseidoniaceae archaeon]